MELLAPAGSLEKLKWAVIYGADAVYFGPEFGSLRSFAGNFSLDDAQRGLDFLHSHDRKGYVTLNIYPFSDEYYRLINTAITLDEMGADAFIISDPGVLMELKKAGVKAGIHISTQANTTSYQAALAYKALGAKRVNLARELSFEQIKAIQEKVRGQVETEVFINGAVCFSYSGRCAISDYLAGFRANHGECKHACRWKYAVVEETRPGRYMPVFEDERGLYLFNSKELALFEFVPGLKDAGVDSIKIEGRMKSIHYIATVVSFYRQVLDGKRFSWDQGMEFLSRAPNRGYSTGFMKGGIDRDDYQWEKSTSQSEAIFVANVTEEILNDRYVIEIRNKVHAGEELEVLSTDGSLSLITLPSPLTTRDFKQVEFANHSQFIIIEQALQPYSILRRVGRHTSGRPDDR
ncbi:Collagenase-like protease [uncultured Desulfobacterium sp.]|uniref:Collagenase-like protease n=1 Tax=uncultured Desulfobacterium sp. TaxID=201089 RepID=A0A445MV03_9BACT|nr:Collagenase-like protease [uncultured Desulfobacterium sp.]